MQMHLDRAADNLWGQPVTTERHPAAFARGALALTSANCTGAIHGLRASSYLQHTLVP